VINQPHICKGCGEIIPIKKGRSSHPTAKRKYLYCSRGCAYKHFKEWAKVGLGEAKPKHCPIHFYNCLICGKLFTSHYKKKKPICSDQCLHAYDRWYFHEYAIKRHEHITHKRLCKYCNKEFIPQYGSKKRAFCSSKCLKRWGSKQSKIKRGSFNSKRKLMRIYFRDNGICGICHKRISLKNIYPHDLCPSIDHILPVSLGGNHKDDNLRVTHLRCNVSRGNNIKLDQCKLNLSMKSIGWGGA